jgi:hypothetical protein
LIAGLLFLYTVKNVNDFPVPNRDVPTRESLVGDIPAGDGKIDNLYFQCTYVHCMDRRFEYGEMNITKLNHRIDDIEDEIYREKMKIQKCADEMDDTFDDMLAHY